VHQAIEEVYAKASIGFNRYTCTTGNVNKQRVYVKAAVKDPVPWVLASKFVRVMFAKL
jgi:hypothetical protein